MTIHLGRPSPDASRDLPGRSAKTCLAVRRSANLSSLYGLAPGGVYNASSVAGAAVRSYRTLSPLPTDDKRASAVYFLLHFPWGRPRRALPGTVFPWSPDFPPLAGFPDAKGSHPTVWLPICAAASAAGQAIFAQVAINRAVSESTVASTFVDRKCR
jgi:hypothetical protein